MKKTSVFIVFLLFGLCAAQCDVFAEKGDGMAQEASQNIQKATFAGGCFWCMEHPFDVREGVISTISGYAGGQLKNPTYEQVSSGQTKHAEVMQVTYDANQISYGELLGIFWKNINPTTPNQQFADKGPQYRSAIFYHDEEQKTIALKTKDELEKSARFSGPIVTEIVPLTNFYPAEDYHQDYYIKNPIRYKFYRHGSGRDQYLDKTWGKKRDE